MRPASRYRPNREAYATLRLCGVGAVTAGVLFVVWGYVDRPHVYMFRETAVDVLSFIVPALFLMGLIGIYVSYKRRRNPLGRIGLVVGFVGSGLGVLLGLAHMASLYGHWLLFLWDAVWLPTLLAGLTLTGIASVGKRRLRGLGASSLATGMFGWAYFVTEAIGILETRLGHIAFGLAFSLGWMALGLALMRRGAAGSRFQSF